MTALPTRKLEAWRYTDLRPLAAMGFTPAEPRKIDAAALPDLGIPRIAFINGVFSASLSTPPEEFSRVAEVGARQEPDDLPLARINAAHAADGAVLHVPAGRDGGAALLVAHNASGAEPMALHPFHRITLGAGARLVLVEVAEGSGVYWHNAAYDIALGAGAVLEHWRLQRESAQAFHTATASVSVADGARYDSFTLGLGGRIARTETHAALTGANAALHLNAAQLLAGSQHGDITSVIRHAAPGCASRQTVKTVLADRARGVFQGRIEVAREAQKTDGYQMNQALLLSDDAEMNAKPELEIFADDVKCSHGATVGALDPEQLFYLRSRGIPAAEARGLLVRAFLDEAIEPVSHAGARALLEAAIEAARGPSA